MRLPTTVSRAILLLHVLVLLGAVTTGLSIALRDELLTAVGYPTDSSIKPLSFAPVAIVLFIVFAGLVWVLVPFVRGAHNWARHSAAAVVLGVALATLAGLRTGPPVEFVVCSVVTLVVAASSLFFLWHKDTGAFMRGEQVPEAAPTA